ncbi:unannotated protein [freshwater metagenome]|uniref:Unannotated protein n=1 Tax=freshwater metagenome TaxID=449393 RepID=A0A6J5YPF4_9ZZZZ
MWSRALGALRGTTTTSETWFAPVDSPFRDKFAAATNDGYNGFRSWRVWLQIGSQSVRRQYSRTTLGPWWNVIQEALFIVAVGFVWGPLFGTQPQGYVSYLAVGFIVFNLISALLSQAASTFIVVGGIANRHATPLTSNILEKIADSVIRFLHSAVIIIALIATGDFHFSSSSWVSLWVFCLLLLNAYLLSLWLGPLTVRFRDIEPSIHAVMRLMFFVTPVMWVPTALLGTSRSKILELNPFYYFLDGIRNPLLGIALPNHEFAVLTLITLFNAVAGITIFTWTRSRITYWGLQ